MNDPIAGAVEFVLGRLSFASGVAIVVKAADVGRVVGLSVSDVQRKASEICKRVKDSGLCVEFAGDAFRVTRPLLEACVAQCLEEYKTKGQWETFLTTRAELTDKDRAAVDAEVRQRLGKAARAWPHE